MNTETNEQIKSKSEAIDNIMLHLKIQKINFTKEFYSQHNRENMTWQERKQLNVDYQNAWESKEKEIVKSISEK